MEVPFVDLKAQYETLKIDIDKAIHEVLGRAHFVKGIEGAQFEKEFAAFHGVGHCIGCGNGTDALEIILKAMGIGSGDEVIVPANSFIASSEAVSSVGATPIFVDIDPVHYSINPEYVVKAITKRTKAIIPVHLYGIPAPMSELLALARQYELRIIEDCAQAHGATIHGQLIGTFGDAAAFSFYPGKNLGAYGDAGAIITNDPRLAKTCMMAANHGRVSKYDHEFEGRNSRLDELQAAVIRVKLPHLQNWNALRRKHAARYDELLSGLPVVTPKFPDGTTPVFHLYVIRTTRRNELQHYLNEHGIASGIHYPLPLPLLQAYRNRGFAATDFPVSAEHMNELLSLPMYPELTEEQQYYVVDTINRFFRHSPK